EVPVLVPLAGVDRTRVAAAHGDDDVRRANGVIGQRFREPVGDVDADFAHRIDRNRVDLIAGLGAGGADGDAATAEPLHETGGHLASAGVVRADEADLGKL